MHATPKLLQNSVLILPLVIILHGCVTPEYTKRYRDVVGQSSTRAIPASPVILRTSTFLIETSKEKAKPKLLAELSDRALAQAMRSIGGDGTMSDSNLLGLLARPIKPNGGPESGIDRTTFKHKVAVSVEYPDFGAGSAAADRLQFLDTHFTLCQSDLSLCAPLKIDINGSVDSRIRPKFKSWSAISNEYQTVESGDIEAGQTAKASITTPIKGVELGAEASNSLTEKVSLKHETVRMYGFLDGHTAHVIQRGAFQKDLIGIHTFEFTASLEKGGTLDVALDFDQGQKGEKPNLMFGTVQFPKSCDPVYLQTFSSGKLRMVRNGHDTVTESDDVVAFVTAKSSPESQDQVELIAAKDFLVPSWTVENGGRKLHFAEIPGGEKPIRFTSLVEVNSFWNWIRQLKPSGNISFNEGQLFLPLRGRLVPVTNARQLNGFLPVRKTVGCSSATPTG